jgi:hypothetical protein
LACFLRGSVQASHEIPLVLDASIKGHSPVADFTKGDLYPALLTTIPKVLLRIREGNGVGLHVNLLDSADADNLIHVIAYELHIVVITWTD